MLREPRGLRRRLWREYRPAFNHANRKAQKIEQSDQSKEIEVNSIFIVNPMHDAMPVKVVHAVVFVGFFQKSFTNEIAEHHISYPFIFIILRIAERKATGIPVPTRPA
jgi:hypothetical protein